MLAAACKIASFPVSWRFLRLLRMLTDDEAGMTAGPQPFSSRHGLIADTGE